MEMQAPDFWDDPEVSNKKMKESKNMKDIVDTMNGLSQQYEDILTLIEMGYEENDPEMIPARVVPARNTNSAAEDFSRSLLQKE